jgi:hypothetical protein
MYICYLMCCNKIVMWRVRCFVLLWLFCGRYMSCSVISVEKRYCVVYVNNGVWGVTFRLVWWLFWMFYRLCSMMTAICHVVWWFLYGVRTIVYYSMITFVCCMLHVVYSSVMTGVKCVTHCLHTEVSVAYSRAYDCCVAIIFFALLLFCFGLCT